MQILVIAIVAAIAVLLLPRFLGRRQERMLAQYAVLEKRFGLERRVSRSKWGKGIGEHYSLAGEYRGYSISLYGHFHKEPGGRRTDWTSLVFETLFAGDVELRIDFPGTQEAARFPELGFGVVHSDESRARLVCSEAEAFDYLLSASARERLRRFAQQDACGAVSLSKGFLEYREVGGLEDEAMRLRYQDALLLLAELADALSIFVSRRKADPQAEPEA